MGTAGRPANAQKIRALVHRQGTLATDLINQIAITLQFQRLTLCELCLFAFHAR
jgi:hypothetical protein